MICSVLPARHMWQAITQGARTTGATGWRTDGQVGTRKTSVSRTEKTERTFRGEKGPPIPTPGGYTVVGLGRDPPCSHRDATHQDTWPEMSEPSAFRGGPDFRWGRVSAFFGIS